jgi:hypothetical protein
MKKNFIVLVIQSLLMSCNDLKHKNTNEVTLDTITKFH